MARHGARQESGKEITICMEEKLRKDVDMRSSVKHSDRTVKLNEISKEDKRARRLFYVYTPVDGEEDGMFSGYTIGEAKAIAKQRAADLKYMGLTGGAQVRRRDDCNVIWATD